MFYKLYEAVLASRPARLLDGSDRRGERIFIPGRPPSRTELPAPNQGAPFGLSVENLANWVYLPAVRGTLARRLSRPRDKMALDARPRTRERPRPERVTKIRGNSEARSRQSPPQLPNQHDLGHPRKAGPPTARERARRLTGPPGPPPQTAAAASPAPWPPPRPCRLARAGSRAVVRRADRVRRNAWSRPTSGPRGSRARGVHEEPLKTAGSSVARARPPGGADQTRRPPRERPLGRVVARSWGVPILRHDGRTEGEKTATEGRLRRVTSPNIRHTTGPWWQIERREGSGTELRLRVEGAIVVGRIRFSEAVLRSNKPVRVKHFGAPIYKWRPIGIALREAWTAPVALWIWCGNRRAAG